MVQVFERFKHLFENRYKRISVLDLGEDSVRYVFFTAARDILNLESWQIQLEHPIHPEAFQPRENAKRKRDEKPQIDLWIETEESKTGVEFAIFKRNKVDGSPINDTEYAFKLLNDFMRLALHGYLANSQSYFVCVADSMMLGKQLFSRKIDSFPGELYEFDHTTLVDIMSDYLSAKKIDTRFLVKLKHHGLNVKAERVGDDSINSDINQLTTKAIMWRITAEKK
jgi:hypothetical protein